MKDSLIKLVLVGVGKIARDQHVPALGGNPRFALVATASPQGTIPGVDAYADLDAMLAGNPHLDAVALCTPPAVRAGLAQQALAAGLHVMLEKPPAASLSQVDAMASAARAAGRSLFATWHSRETAAVDAAAAWLAPRRIDAVRLVWREDVRVWHPGQDWLLAAGGFGVFDPAINAFSILTRILPEPLALESARLGVPANREAPVSARLTMRHGNHAAVECDLSILHSGCQQWDIAIDTDAGQLLLTDGGHRLLIDGAAQVTEGDSDGEYARLYARFARLIDAGESDVDVRPLMLVENAMMRGRVTVLAPFEF